MHDPADTNPRSERARAASGQPQLALRCAVILSLTSAVLGGLAACGGGGGGPAQPDVPIFVDGLAGSVLLPDFDLGRVVEQEPNNSAAQAFDVAPLDPRSILEVAGDLGMTAAQFGRVDTQDVLRVVSPVDQRISLRLAFEPDDPVGAGLNDVSAAAIDTDSGIELASTAPGAQPLTLAFDATAGVRYDLAVTIAAGHAAYVVRLTGSDLAPVPVPLQAKPAGQPTAAQGLPARAAPSTRVAATPSRCAGTHLLVRFEEACDPAVFCSENGVCLGRRTATGSYLVHFDCPAAENGEARARAIGKALAARSGVRWAEPDWIITSQGEPSDPLYNRQWHWPMVGAPSAWDVVTGDASVVVGVLDTGVIAHPDLEGQLVPGYDFISEPARADDGDGRDADPTDMGDRFDTSGLSVWHGTHVAALVAGKQGDGTGGTGMAPGVRVMMLRALGIGGGLVSDAADAILYAAALYRTADGHELESPLPILNLSLGLSQDAPDLRDACSRASNNGVLIIGAAGNTGGGVLYPAAYPSVLAVSAVDGGMATTSYSNFGPEVDIAAPGGGTGRDAWNDGWADGVLSAVRDETVDPATYGHAYIVGTSQAAPQVAGAAALLLSVDPSLNAPQLRNILRNTALDLGVPGEDIAYGAGLLQVHEAVKFALTSLGTPRVDPPYLMLPTRSLQFDDFGAKTILVDIPLFNGGSGKLNVFTALTSTDDGAAWLSAALVPDPSPGAPVNNKEVTISVDRLLVPSTPGRYAGYVRLANVSTILGSIRVVLYVDQQTRAGQNRSVVAIEEATGIAQRKAFATADRGYRFWIRGVPSGEYALQAGEDLDFNGFLCESFEACAWFGGPTKTDAVLVPFAFEQPATTGLGISLVPQPPP